MKIMLKTIVLGFVIILIAGCLWEPTSEGTPTSPVTLSQYDVYQGSVGRLSSSYYVVTTDLMGVNLDSLQGDVLQIEFWLFSDISVIDSKNPADAMSVIPIDTSSYLNLNFGGTYIGPLYFRIDSIAPVVGQKYTITIN